MLAKQIEKEFLENVRINQNIINKICFIYSSTAEERKDIYQEIILQLWKSFPSFKGNSSFSTWMYRVALNTAITLNKKPGIITRDSGFHDSAYDPEVSQDYSEDLKILYKAISQLKQVERGIILMWLDEKSYEEIAATFGITITNVSVKLVRIKATLSGLIKNLQ